MPQFNNSHRWTDSPASSEVVQPGGMLEDFAVEGDQGGIAIDSLAPGSVIEVTTRNTQYRLTLLDTEGHALITGGSLFPRPTEVRIEGATAGGSALKLGWIGVGLRLELSLGGRLITTSAVKSVEPVAA
jgi:hypothetical protein